MLTTFDEKILSLNNPKLSYYFISKEFRPGNNKHAKVIIDSGNIDMIFHFIGNGYANWRPFADAIYKNGNPENNFKVMNLLYAEIYKQFEKDLSNPGFDYSYCCSKVDKQYAHFKKCAQLIVDSDDKDIKIRLIQLHNEKVNDKIENKNGESVRIGYLVFEHGWKYDDIVSKIYNSFSSGKDDNYIDTFKELVPCSAATIDEKIKNFERILNQKSHK